ncbi:MAG: hypothetical protein RR555_09565 [Bacteroidales bacterium]
MKTSKLIVWLVALILGGFAAGSCSKSETTPPGSGIAENIRAANEFIAANMHEGYLWSNKIAAGIDPQKERIRLLCWIK